MFKKTTICIITLMVLINIAYAVDLSDYPEMFVKGGNFDGALVVGEDASAQDVIAASNIVSSLSSLANNVGSVKLANEISDIYAQSLIIIGNPCNNHLSGELAGSSQNCLQGFETDTGIISLTNKNNHYQLLVAGYSNEDTRNAGKVLAAYKDYDFRGKKIKVTKNSQGDLELEYSNFVKKSLSDYPDMFGEGRNFDTIIVVGDDASSSDVIVQSRVGLSLMQNLNMQPMDFKLASEIDDLGRDIISIGSPCVNELTAEIMGNPSPCDKDFEEGKAYLKLYGKDDYIHLIVAGSSDESTMKVADVLVDYDSYSLEGDEYILEVKETAIVAVTSGDGVPTPPGFTDTDHGEKEDNLINEDIGKQDEDGVVSPLIIPEDKKQDKGTAPDEKKTETEDDEPASGEPNIVMKFLLWIVPLFR